MSDRIIPQDTQHGVVTFKLLANGKDVSQDYTVMSFSVQREVNRIPRATVVLRDGDVSEETFPASEGRDWVPGTEIEIKAGFDSRDESIFKGLVVKQTIRARESGSTLTLLCKDKAARMTIGRQSRYFEKQKDSDALKAIIGEHGLQAKVDATTETHPELVQHQATDWDFVLSRAEANSLIVWVMDGEVSVKKPALSGSPILSLAYGANVIGFDLELDAETQLQAVEATSWNFTQQKIQTSKGSEPSVPALGNLTGKKLGEVLSPKNLALVHPGQVKQPELKAWAEGQLLKSRLAKVRGTIKTQGFPGAKADALVELTGMGARFNGKAYVSGFRHELQEGAWYTYLQLGLGPDWFGGAEKDITQAPASGLLPGIRGLHPAVVKEIADDPEGEARIKVVIHTLDHQGKGTWARLATLDAGNERGTFFLPEVSDEVIVGFINEDPRDAVILGMLHSSKLKPPLTATKDNHEKGLVTRSKLKLMFDDDKKVITLETPGGNLVTISDEAKGIELKDQNGNTLTLDDKGITLKSPKDITLEATGKVNLKATQDASIEGMNLNLKAQAQFKAEGSAGAEVSTSAIAVLKGSLVQIN